MSALGTMIGMKTMKLWRSFLWLAAMVTSLGAPAAETVTYYHNDLAGSPVVATDASGNVIWRESYRPYGERLTNAPASADNKIWFTSRRQDVETGLVYMGARYYDPVIGRFISTDPAGFNDQNLHSHNRYAYANNNPYRYIDPTGAAGESFVLRGLMGAAMAAGFSGLAQSPEQKARNVQALQDAWRDLFGLTTILSEKADGDTASGANSGDDAKGSTGGTRSGKPFTPKGKAEIDAENADRNGGLNVCENCGQQVVPGEKSQKGVRPPGNERQRDHIIPQSKGGDGDPSNGQILCRDCNAGKGNRYP